MEIAATINVANAGVRLWDAVVIGAGPAGSLAARELARRGLSILLVDNNRFPRTKVCGCCLNLRALATLARAGLGDLVHRCRAAPLNCLTLAVSSSQARVPLSGMVLSREAFDFALVQAAVEAGAEFLPETHATLVPVADPGHRITILRQKGAETAVSSRIVIGAGGLGGTLLADDAQHHSFVESTSRLGAGTIAEHYPASYRSETVYMACAQGGYVGLVRLEDQRLNVAAAFDAGFVKHAGSLGRAAANTLAEAGFPGIAGLDRLSWHGTPRLTRQALRPAAHRIFLLGDAASFVEPFTGEGIAWALASALAVVQYALRACRDWHPALIWKWSDCYRQRIIRRQNLCRAAAYVLRRPKLVRFIVAALNRFPFLAAPIVRHLDSTRGITSELVSM